MSDPLTDAEKTDARRFLGYPAYGLGEGDPTFARYFNNSITLEYRLGNLLDSELDVSRDYLLTLSTLEAAIPASADNLEADAAASYVHNKFEVRDRLNLLSVWSRRFAAFLGVPLYSSTGSSGSIRLVV